MNEGTRTKPAIEVVDLECRYGDTLILRDVSFAVEEAEIFFIVGGNGSGKSTLLRHMIGLIEPTRGRVCFFGECFNEADPVRRHELQRDFGVLYQSSALWSSMTLAENIALPLEEHTTLSREERNEIVSLRLTQVGLGDASQLFPAQLSGGMRRRAALARALALDPSIVFFDEPGAGLDPMTSRTLDALIAETRELFGTTMVIVSHHLQAIYGLADRIIVLDPEDKTIIARGDPRELAEGPDERVRELLRRDDPATKESAS